MRYFTTITTHLEFGKWNLPAIVWEHRLERNPSQSFTLYLRTNYVNHNHCATSSYLNHSTMTLLIFYGYRNTAENTILHTCMISKLTRGGLVTLALLLAAADARWHINILLHSGRAGSKTRQCIQVEHNDSHTIRTTPVGKQRQLYIHMQPSYDSNTSSKLQILI